MFLYGAVSKMVVLSVSIHVVVGSNLGEQKLFFFFFFPIDLKTISFTETYESVVIFKFPRRLYFYVFNIYNAGLLNTKSRRSLYVDTASMRGII